MDALAIPGAWITQGGAGGLLGLVVLLIISGRLVPRTTFRALERDRDHWRDVAMKAVSHADQLLPAARITTEMVTALTATPTPATAVATAAAGQPLDGPAPDRKRRA